MYKNFTKQRKWRFLMRVSLVYLFLLIGGIQLLSASNSRGQGLEDIMVTIDVNEGNLESLFKRIEHQTPLTFAYLPSDVQKYNQVTLKPGKQTVKFALDQALKNTALSYRSIENSVVIFPKLSSSKRTDILGVSDPNTPLGMLDQVRGSVRRPEKALDALACISPIELYNKRMVLNITGKVTDVTGEPLIGVNILVKGTNKGTTTDLNGEFSLEDVDDQAVLILSYIGYQSQEISVGGQTSLTIIMQEDVQTLDEVVVVGYGTQKKENLTGAVSSVASEDISNQPELQVSSALMGKVPGLTITQSSGQPGENQGTLRIRGIGTLGNSSPLILIDGVEGYLQDISPQDIDQISILKDASSSAIYGSRAANGVILITTKRGSEGMKLSYSGNFGIQNPTNLPEYLESDEYMRLENKANENLGNPPVWSEDYIRDWQANHNTDPDNYPNTDWLDLLFSEQAVQQQHHITISGGKSENVLFRGSLSYEDQKGAIPQFGFRRYSARLNTDIRLSDHLNLLLDLNVVREDKDESSYGLGNLTLQAHRLGPIWVAINSDGTFGDGFAYNPVARARAGGDRTDEISVFRGRFQVKYKLNDDWDVHAMYAPEYGSSFQKDMRKQFKVYQGGQVVRVQPNLNWLNQRYGRDFTNNFNLISTFHKEIHAHSFKILGGYEFINFRSDYFNAFRDDFPLQQFEVLNAASPVNQQNSGGASDWALQSLFARFNYNFQERYLLEANIRRDGSSRFTKDNRWGIFPSFSLGWRLSRQPFAESIHWISDLLVRASWGELGNQLIGNYPFASVVNFGSNFLFGDQIVGGTSQNELANPEISWETTTSKNIGVDISFLNNQLGITVDWFDRQTRDILLQLPVPLIIGMAAPTQNAGTVENKGLELAVNYKNPARKSLNYGVSLNLSYVRNKVIDLKGTGPFLGGVSITREGDPIGSIYTYKAEGLFRSQSEIDAHAAQIGQIAPGDIKYADLNDDGVINADDRTITGNPFPDLNYGCNLYASYKNFEINAFLQGSRRDVILQEDLVWAFFNGGQISRWQADNFWSADRPEASYPRLTAATAHNNFTPSSFWVYDGTYLRLRTARISFTLPAEWMQSLSNLEWKIYLAGQNLLTWDRMPPGIDPNVPNNSAGAIYPIQRVFSAGINIHF